MFCVNGQNIDNIEEYSQNVLLKNLQGFFSEDIPFTCANYSVIISNFSAGSDWDQESFVETDKIAAKINEIFHKYLETKGVFSHTCFAIGLYNGWNEPIKKDIYTYLYFFGISPSKENPLNVRILKEAKSTNGFRENNPDHKSVWISGKPKKIMEKLLPGLPDSVYQEFTTWWISRYSSENEEGISFHVRNTPEDFENVYTMETCDDSRFTMGTVDGVYYKSLNNSCMRKESEHICSYVEENAENHPAYVYGSGDFIIMYVTKNNKLMGRCVARVSDGIFSPGPAYITSNIAMKHISAYIKEYSEKNNQKIQDNCWVGAKLLKVLFDNNKAILMPYLDCSGYIDFCKGEPFVKISGSQYDNYTWCASGYIESEEFFCRCEHCNGRIINEEDVFYGVVDFESNSYCESCFESVFVPCKKCGNTHHKNNMRIVNVSQFFQENYCEECFNEQREEFIEYDSWYYTKECMIEAFNSSREKILVPYWKTVIEAVSGEVFAKSETNRISCDSWPVYISKGILNRNLEFTSLYDYSPEEQFNIHDMFHCNKYYNEIQVKPGYTLKRVEHKIGNMYLGYFNVIVKTSQDSL